jgi:hypothetical protein
VMWAKKRTEVTRCGRRWGYETDDEPPPVYVRGAMHMGRGLLVVSLCVMMMAQLGMLPFPTSVSYFPGRVSLILTYTAVFKWTFLALWVPGLLQYRLITDSNLDIMLVSWAHLVSLPSPLQPRRGDYSCYFAIDCCPARCNVASPQNRRF